MLTDNAAQRSSRIGGNDFMGPFESVGASEGGVNLYIQGSRPTHLQGRSHQIT